MGSSHPDQPLNHHRRAVLLGLASASLASPALAGTRLPDFARAMYTVPRPTDIGPLGMRNGGSGFLQSCLTAGTACVGSFEDPYGGNYIPPWTYQNPEKPKAPKKSLEQAMADLKSVLSEWPGAVIVNSQERYVYAEVEDELTGAIDDVEFLFSNVQPILGYRTASRGSKNDKRQRERIKGLRKALETKGDWMSVGRFN